MSNDVKIEVAMVEARLALKKEAIEVVTRMDQQKEWDQIQARDLDPRLTDYVTKLIHQGMTPREICEVLGIPSTTSKAWKKIQAHFRQGFRADAEGYLMQQTVKFYRKIEKMGEILDDAIQNGTPQAFVVPQGKDQPAVVEIIKIKGATRDLAGFAKAYADCIELPVKLWKQFGAIGDTKSKEATGITILVQNNIPMPTEQEINAKRAMIAEKMKTIEVKNES